MQMNVELTINGKKVSAPEGSTILEAARLAGIQIPTLCFTFTKIYLQVLLEVSTLDGHSTSFPISA